MRFGVVDNEAHPDIGNRLSVEAYPTTLVFRSDKGVDNPIKYTGPRSTDELITFLMGQVREFVVAGAKKEVSIQSVSSLTSVRIRGVYLSLFKNFAILFTDS